MTRCRQYSVWAKNGSVTISKLLTGEWLVAWTSYTGSPSMYPGGRSIFPNLTSAKAEARRHLPTPKPGSRVIFDCVS